ncbi:MAG TPA: hypothetical protein VFA51_09115 [Candidatus Udaeobacter sp.]|nr:hypothetical protein [Candidatus Udaeobacter sp.]
MNAILEALEGEDLPAVKRLLEKHNGEPFEHLVLDKYLEGNKPVSWKEQELSPDSQEAQEAAQLDERRLVHGAVVWQKLSPDERQSLVKATSAIYGPSQGEELEQSLTMRIY